MRAIEFYESAVTDLKRKLPNLSKTDYDAVDELMTRIGKRYKINTKKLHNLFVSKYGESPDHWIKKYKEKLGEKTTPAAQQAAIAISMKKAGKKPKNVNEEIDTTTDLEKVKDFIKWTIKTLNLKKPLPKIILSKDTKKAQNGRHTGLHTTKDGISYIWVYVDNRNLIDIFRTVFHELVHQKQDQLGMIKPGDSYPGSPIEAMADMLAGKYIKIYGKEHPEIFQ